MNRPTILYYLVVTALLIIAIAIGIFNGLRDLDNALFSVNQSFSNYDFLKDLSNFDLFLLIFANNSVKALVTIILGLFFGLVPLYFIYVNGELIGLVVAVSVYRSGLAFTLAGLLPHGILEIPALIIAASYGLWLGFRLWRYIRRREPLGPAIRSALVTYGVVILPMLLIAALIEAYITPQVIDAVIRAGHS